MLGLAAPTDPGWGARVVADLDELLLDHAHCEKKAAGVAVGLIFRYPRHTGLAEPLSRLAREELAHFEEVLARMAERGIAFRPLRASPYAGRLRRALRSGEPERLVDVLLVSSLIEARSCERFALLADAVDDAALAGFYRGLLASEARHHRTYVELACQVQPRDAVRVRLEQLAALEARVLAGVPPLARMHA
jgi:tRNA-(ms[2]io[6]A)-hydroxylase